MHKIDLSKYDVRTDMTIDLIEQSNKKINLDNYVEDGIKVSWIRLDKDNDIGKEEGTYLTLEFSDVTDNDYSKRVSNVFKTEFKKMLDIINFNNDTKTLIIGLGNIKSTPDSLGPLVSNDIIVTKHLYDMKLDVDKNFTNVSSIYPGVTGDTGIETLDIIKGIVQKTKPDLVILVDALSSTSLSRINKSIQVSDTGISPGSGIGNNRKIINKKELGIPVISIGIPTVVSAAIIVSDTINYMFKNYSYNKMISNKASKLVTKPINYLNKNITTNFNDRATLLGLVGSLNEEELKDLVYEVLSPIGYNFMVSPKEEDFIIKKLSNIISYGINHCIHTI